jgi:xanthine dehydrogenase accessory factor
MDVYEELIRERSAGRMCVLATIVNAVGSVPSHATAKLMLRADGTIVGTVGGGAAEAAVIEEAKLALASGKPRLVEFDLHENPRMDIGMVCGGSLKVFIEAIRPAPVAYLVGAGHVGTLTAAAARIARIDVEVIDDRPEFANADRFPGARAIHSGDIDATLAGLKPDSNALIFIAGRSHELDARALRWAVDTPAFYIGMIGSRRKVQFIYHKLKTDGITDEQLGRVHAPVGLNIGAATPEEIAISVVAEMVAEIRHVEAAQTLMSNMRDVAATIGRKISQARPDRQNATIERRPAPKSDAAPIAGLAANY